MHQKIIVKVEGSFIKQGNNDAIEIVMENEKLPIPKIGVGRANERNENYYEALKALSAIGFSHYRVDIKLNNDDWQQTLKECFNEAALLNTKLEIALFVYAGCTKKISVFVDAIKSRKDIQQIILLEEHAKCISNHLLHEVLFMLRPQLPGIIIGAGTDIYFAELNRSNLDTSDIDYVSYSANPQVHAFDDASLMENTEGQFATVISAKNKFIKPVHISPVTLKMRYNADAGEQNTYALTPLADARQQTFFGAAWTLLSLKELCEARVSSVTYFETVGKTGLMDADTFQSYPLLEVFKLLYPSSIYYIKKSNCIPDNMQCNSFVFGNDHIQFTAVCNYGESEIQLNLKDHADLYTIVIFSKKKDNAKQTTTKKLPIAYRLLLPGQSIIFIEKRLK